MRSGWSQSGGIGLMNLGQAKRNNSSRIFSSSSPFSPPLVSLESCSPYFSRRTEWIESSRRVGVRAMQIVKRAYI